MQKLIFIVDDNDACLTMAASALESEYRVLTMPSAEKMFSLLEKKAPDLILLDVLMPGMGGFDAIAKLKEHPVWSAIPVVFLTGMIDDELLASAVKAGALDVISKNIAPSALLDSVNKHLPAGDTGKNTDKARTSVLVVDDQEAGVAALTQILNPEYTVYVAENGKKAIEAAEKYLPDIILLDILMVDMDGYAVIAALKSSEITKNIPVIFVTGLSDHNDEEKGLALGAVDYITKPFSPAIVKLRIRNQIQMLGQLRTIKRLSMHDSLTDLPNRRNFENRLNIEWGRALREQEAISLLLIDVDNFKNYNDTYGHQHGDAALTAVAKVFAGTLKRTNDMVARWGGEEFIALLPNTEIKGALEIAELMRKNVEDTQISCAGKPAAKVTVSIGINTWTPGRRCGAINELISGADAALYSAKNAGRNRVHILDN